MSGGLQYLSKSAFKLACTCPTKLYYHLKKYPRLDAESEYGEVLKKGGHFIGRLAQLMYPDGRPLPQDISFDEAVKKTAELLKEDKVTLFEAALASEGKAAYIDILKRNKNTFHLIEVKSKSINGNAHREKSLFRTKNGISTEWLPYIEDVAFQGIILKELYPKNSIKYFLLLPDKSKVIFRDGFGDEFRQIRNDHGKLEVIFEGKQESILNDNFMSLFDVTEEVDMVIPSVKEMADMFLRSMSPNLTKIRTPHGKHCKDCEFKHDEGPNGFKECWGELAEVSPSIFDLWYGGALRDGKEFLLNTLVRNKKVSLYDIPLESLTGPRGKRQAIQIKHTREAKEWISDELKEKLNELVFPLHFVDFETARPPIPFHKGMSPFEQIAFQWSLHTLESPDSNPIHKEWIHTEKNYPNFRFVRSLKDAVGEEGTILTWASHEWTTLDDILKRLNSLEDRDVIEWLKKVPERIVDMEKLCQEHYFHPSMKGKTSLKTVLPCVWEAEGVNPYAELPRILIAGEEKVISEGTGAIIAYNEMVYMANEEDEKRKWEELLLQYCKLDTYAMVVIYKYWRRKGGERPSSPVIRRQKK